VRKGDLVSIQQAVVRILRAGDLWIKVFVPETELGKASNLCLSGLSPS
jgi:HlyD family secretion protein